MRIGFFYSIGLSKRTFSSNFASIFAILVLSVLTITPLFYAQKIFMVLWAIFFCLEFNQVFRTDGKLKSVLTWGVLFIFICIVYKIFGVSSATISYCAVPPFSYFVPISALIIIDKCHNEQQIRFLFHSISLVTAINIADNIRLSYVYGLDVVFQNLAGILEEEGISGLNLGGSMFVSMSVFYASIMFLAFLKSKNNIEKILFLLYVCITAYFIIMCSLKASAIVLMLISFLSMYISVKMKKNVGVALLIMAIVGIIMFLFMDNIVYFLINVIGAQRIADRLIIFTTGAEYSDSSTLVSRGELWQVSVGTWLNDVKSFFLGIGDHSWNEFSTTAKSGIGNHSDLLDVLARYGILGGLCLYSSIKLYYDYLKTIYGKSSKFEILSFFVLILLMGFTKKIVGSQPAVMIFILFPLTLRYFSNKESVKQIRSW